MLLENMPDSCQAGMPFYEIREKTYFTCNKNCQILKKGGAMDIDTKDYRWMKRGSCRNFAEYVLSTTGQKPEDIVNSGKVHYDCPGIVRAAGMVTEGTPHRGRGRL